MLDVLAKARDAEGVRAIGADGSSHAPTCSPAQLRAGTWPREELLVTHRLTQPTAGLRRLHRVRRGAPAARPPRRRAGPGRIGPVPRPRPALPLVPRPGHASPRRSRATSRTTPTPTWRGSRGRAETLLVPLGRHARAAPRPVVGRRRRGRVTGTDRRSRSRNTACREKRRNHWNRYRGPRLWTLVASRVRRCQGDRRPGRQGRAADRGPARRDPADRGRGARRRPGAAPPHPRRRRADAPPGRGVGARRAQGGPRPRRPGGVAPRPVAGVRAAAAQALGLIARPESREPLERALEDGHPGGPQPRGLGALDASATSARSRSS